MATKGGSGIFTPPGDDNVAPVIPLRQRQSNQVAPPARKVLPRERAAFDPELEAGEVVLRRRAHRTLPFVANTSIALTLKPASATLARLAAATALTLVAGVLVWQPFGSPGSHRAPSATTRDAGTPTGHQTGLHLAAAAVLFAHAKTGPITRRDGQTRGRVRGGSHTRSRRRKLAHQSKDPRPTSDPTSATRTPATSNPATPTRSGATQYQTPQSTTPTVTTPPSTGAAAQSTGQTSSSAQQPAFGSDGSLGPGHSPDS
jgi:hypothetical protein